MNQLRNRLPCPTFPMMDAHTMGMMSMNHAPMDHPHHHHHHHHHHHRSISMLGAAMEPFPQLVPWMTGGVTHQHQQQQQEQRGRKKNNTEEAPRIPYPKDFVPTIHHVICGRGKKSYGHVGNKNFLTIVAGHIEEYSKATTKQEKSDIVQSIVDGLESKGGFIRLDPKSGLYFQAEDGAGREKTSQALRDCLNTKYKSSKDIKRKNRKEKRLAKQAMHQHVTEKRASGSADESTDVPASSKTKAAAPKAAAAVAKPPKKTQPKKEDPPAQTTPRATEQVTSSLPPLTADQKTRSASSSVVVVPPRSVSSTSVDMAAAAAAVVGKPISPSPVLGHWVPTKTQPPPSQVHNLILHQVELEPLPFQAEEVEKLPEVIAPFDFF